MVYFSLHQLPNLSYNLHTKSLRANLFPTKKNTLNTVIRKNCDARQRFISFFHRNLTKKKKEKKNKWTENRVHPRSKATTITVCLHATTDIFRVKAPYTNRIAVRGGFYLRRRDEKLIFRHEIARSSLSNVAALSTFSPRLSYAVRPSRYTNVRLSRRAQTIALSGAYR